MSISKRSQLDLPQTLRDLFGDIMNDDLAELGEIFDRHLRRMMIFLPLQFVVLLVVALIR
ncbi:MAG: hypothetical protein FGM42_01035 [Ilumatobacteraceae bacterium]|nr:hypothetical protein [Ilumatobacteraceae bacterium]